MKAKLTNEVVKSGSGFSVQDILSWLKRLAFSDKLRRSELKTYALDRAMIAVARIGLFRDVVYKEDGKTTCACCGAELKEELKTEYHIKHCPYCGQRLKWEAKKEEKRVEYINQEETKDE